MGSRRRKTKRGQGSTRPPPSKPAREEVPVRGVRRRAALGVLAAVFLVLLWLDGAGSNFPARVLPRPLLFFVQVAALFPQAAQVSLDFRAEAWVCSEGKWREIDTRPYFPIHRDDKESRFYRAIHFFRHERKVLQALEGYLIERHARGDVDDGVPAEERVGGVRFSSIRAPLPELGEEVPRWERRPFASYPKSQKKHWYWTPVSKRRERCGDVPPEAEAPWND